ncbi:putative bifunctional diguanylate cyclase/phosphodiesterase [Blastococcus capsensis]|uniref:putative bifunctional diguanylate cyclase/phosphodiesterase n=1 Tax=Blastococcus capsensis TaxID=1564163 RepID=UPI00253FC439|nr:EAL domain-containing protein [Blastococcus capsensis]MDK3258920.1 EAL domain-containing protein [Blastococcus capsensis]
MAEEGGEQAVDQVLDRAGLLAEKAHLQSTHGRVPYSVMLQLFDAVARELDNPRLGLKLGAVALEDPALAPIRALTRVVGSPAAVFRHVSRVSTRLDSTAVTRCVAARAGEAELAWRVLPPRRPTRLDCDYSIGMIEQVPVLFGLPPARVAQKACQVDGAPECEYTVTWREHRAGALWRRWRGLSVAAASRQDAIAHAEERLRGLRSAASDLVSGGSLEETLDRVAERADGAVHARGHLLDLQLPKGVRHVRSRGLDQSVLEIFRERPLEPGIRSVEGAEVLAVEVASATRHYGVLAAVASPGQAFFPEDEGLLAAYAQHAAVGIENSVLLTEVREQEETARLLLTVARSLAGRRTVSAVAQSVAEAVPVLSGADRSAVALWEPGVGRIWVPGSSGWPADLAERLAQYVATPEESPELREMVAAGLPMLIDRGGSTWARDMLDEFGVEAIGAVPIKVDDQLVGIVLAHWVETTPPPILGEALTERLWGLAGLAGVALDNSRLLDEIRRQDSHDALTGLPNRALFEARLESALGEVDREGTQAAVLFCNVSRLKRINDSLGHEAGDELLRQVAGRLSAAVVREGDTVARYSGDEFVVLLPGVGDSDAEDVAVRVRTSLTAPMRVGGEEVFVDLAIGFAVADAAPLAGPQDRRGLSQRLIERAYEDMHRVRAEARGLVHLEQSPERLRVETELRGAVGRGEFRVHLQPQIDLASGRVVAVEALARWYHPEMGLVSPGLFVPIAEDSGMIEEIGEYILREACRVVAGWREQGIDLELAVNVSAVQLNKPDFAELVHQVLMESGLPSDRLVVEVTESQVMSHVAAGNDNLHRLRELGVGISVDDFGTGYSSLAQLRRLPVTEVKVDQAFTAQLTDEDSSAFVAGIVGLGQGLGLRVVAEGVETPAQLDALQGMGCHRAQGYLLGRPADPAAVLDALLAGTLVPTLVAV